MAVLSDTDRATVWAKFMREASASGDALPLLKADLRAAFDAIDTFLDTNAAAINGAIPQPARGALTTKQKALILVDVVLQRYVVTP